MQSVSERHIGRFHGFQRAVEIAYFDRGPIDAEALVTGGSGRLLVQGSIYGTEIIKVLMCWVDAANILGTKSRPATPTFGVFGQQQFPSWPQHPQIALAYVDQLARENEDASRFESLRTSLEMALVRVESNRKDRRLARTLTTHAAELEDSGLRQTKLKTLLLNIVQRLK